MRLRSGSGGAVRAATWVAALLLLAVPRAPHAQQSEQAPPAMNGFYGEYDMTREGSGTSWQPQSTPMSGLMGTRGEWQGMTDAFVNLVYDDQGGPRGAQQTFSTSMLMLMARRELTDGAFGLRLMLSADALMGRSGYPLLLQTGETADGVTPLIDRQHPHDLIMEAALTYSHSFARDLSAFVYAGLPGEPALGPVAFMMRLSARDNPEAPLTHHWLDSTHISWGVITAGATWRGLKFDASAFNGREPDQNRYNIEVRPLDSYSLRLTYNPSHDLSLQGSFGRLASPEQLEPGVSVRRTTFSASYNAPVALWWQTTFAFGHNAPSSGPGSNGWLLESELRFAPAHSVFARLERVDKDELFLEGEPLFGRSFTIEKLSFGYLYEFLQVQAMALGVGALISTYSYPQDLNASYGYRPTSFMVFARAHL
jgi:hypothetical protein